MIDIDGSYMEGGGQIVRTSLALSCLAQKPFEAYNIRKNRLQPGLKAQHLHSINSLQELCNAKVSGASEGSEKIVFEPQEMHAKTLNIDIGTAGSVSLLLQSLLIPCFFADKQITLRLKGGTVGKWAMPVEYLQHVLAPVIGRFCSKISIDLEKRGYFPAGGGRVEIKIKQKYKAGDFSSFDEFLSFIREKEKINLVERGKLICIKGVSHASKDLSDLSVAERQAGSAKHSLLSFGVPVEISHEYSDALCSGSGISLWALFENKVDENPIIIGADSLGEKGKKSEIVGEECAKHLIREINSGACVDSHLCDNLVPWMALFSPSSIKTSIITKHTKTNIFVVEKFLGKCFEIDEKNNILRTI